ncbi:hypothetical protein VZ95_08855, partial [Elstera litoralis]
MMAIRAGLIVQTEFLRLVLRQLLRRQVGVEIVGEGAALADAARLAAANLLIVEQSLCPRALEVLALLGQHPAAQIILVGTGETLPPLAGVPAERIFFLPAGSAASAIDPSSLTERLDGLLRSHRAALPP